MKSKTFLISLLSLSVVAGGHALAVEKEPEDMIDSPAPIEVDIDEEAAFKFASFTGTVKSIEGHHSIDGRKMVLVENEHEEVAYILITENTYIANETTLEEGQIVTGYYNGHAPLILIYPPQYPAEVVVVNDGEMNVKVDIFDENLLSADQELKLTISEETVITTPHGEAYEGSLANRKLVVTYDVSTKSIPAHTTPKSIVVLPEQEEDMASPSDEWEDRETPGFGEISAQYEYEGDAASWSDIVVNQQKVEAPAAFTNENGAIMVPLRPIAEALGYKVGWNQAELRATLGQGISLTLGKDEYLYMRTAPIQLGTAPVLVEGNVFVPLSFFQEVVRVSQIAVSEAQISVTAGEKVE